VVFLVSAVAVEVGFAANLLVVLVDLEAVDFLVVFLLVVFLLDAAEEAFLLVVGFLALDLVVVFFVVLLLELVVVAMPKTIP